MNWMLSGSSPVYQQIISTIEYAVLSGTYLPGQRIPSVRELSIEAKVNPNTMQHALQEMERSGLLISRGTCGRFVTEDVTVLGSMRSRRIQELTREYREKFCALGVSTKEVSELLLELDRREDGV